MSKKENSSSFILIKMDINTNHEIINDLNDSKKENIIKNLELKTSNFNCDIPENNKYSIAFLVFNADKIKVEKIYLGECTIYETSRIDYEIRYELDSTLVIENFISTLGIDLNHDFNKNLSVSIETPIELFRQLEFSKRDIYNLKYCSEKNMYESKEIETYYHEYSQKNEFCRRPYDIKEKNQDDRVEFQIDRERIIHAKSFRRLVDKAQIFTSSRGDHYRTRMTHTLEVAQIAKGISIALKLNNELTEAIALAHDIGHTPFGHQGERTLKNILNDEIKVIPNCNMLELGGFKHNYQGIRVLSYLEEKYMSYEGLNLSYQVLEGILKHTKTDTEYDIDEFLINGEKKYLYLEYEFATTLEGQIVAIADEIAQRSHDLDDALASNHINIDELIKYCSISKMIEIKSILDKIKEQIEELKEKNRIFIDEDDMIRSRIVSDIITFFIQDVILNSRNKLRNHER